MDWMQGGEKEQSICRFPGSSRIFAAMAWHFPGSRHSPPATERWYNRIVGGTSAAGQTRPAVGTGTKARLAGRVAVRQLGGSRLGRATASAVSATLRSLSRAAQILFLQVAGLFFVAFAIIGGIALVTEYRAYMAGRIGPGRSLIALGIVVLFGWFGVSSFLRAGQKLR
jgi:hypothetical protein